MWRWLWRIAVVLAGVVVVGVGALYGITEWRMRTRFAVTPDPLVIPTDAAALARGRHIVETVASCANCHAADLGGKMFVDAGWMVARLPSSNLTRGKGGIGARYTDADWVRAIRHGVAPDGRPLVFMPPHDFDRMGRDDLAAVIAYVKSVPPVDRVAPPMHIGPLGRLFVLREPRTALPASRIDHSAPIPDRAPAGLVERGEQLAAVSGCHACHSPDLTGGQGPAPGASNLTPVGLSSWTEEDFRRTIRTGRTPRGRELAPSMPRDFASFTDDELHAIWAYLRSVPARGEKTQRQLGS